MRMTRIHYDALEVLHSRGGVPEGEFRRAVVANLTTHGTVRLDRYGFLQMTDHGRAELRRVRGVGHAPKGSTYVTSDDTLTAAVIRRLAAKGWFSLVEKKPGRWLATVTPHGIRASEKVK